MNRFYRLLAMFGIALAASVVMASSSQAMNRSADQSNYCLCKDYGNQPALIGAYLYEPMYEFVGQKEWIGEAWFGAGFEDPFWCKGFCAAEAGTHGQDTCAIYSLGSEGFTQPHYYWFYYTTAGTFGGAVTVLSSPPAPQTSCGVPKPLKQ